MLTQGSGGPRPRSLAFRGGCRSLGGAISFFFGVRELVRGGVRGFQLLDVSSSGCKNL